MRIRGFFLKAILCSCLAVGLGLAGCGEDSPFAQCSSWDNMGACRWRACSDAGIDCWYEIENGPTISCDGCSCGDAADSLAELCLAAQ